MTHRTQILNKVMELEQQKTGVLPTTVLKSFQWNLLLDGKLCVNSPGLAGKRCRTVGRGHEPAWAQPCPGWSHTCRDEHESLCSTTAVHLPTRRPPPSPVTASWNSAALPPKCVPFHASARVRTARLKQRDTSGQSGHFNHQSTTNKTKVTK